MLNTKILSLFSLVLLTSNLFAANPLRQRAAFVARAVVARIGHQPARAAIIAPAHVQTRQMRTVNPHISRAAVCTGTNEQPSLEECAKELPNLLQEKARLDKDRWGMERGDWLKKWLTNQEAIDRYRKPILDHLEARKRSASAQQKESLVYSQLLLETEPHRVLDHLEDMIRE